MLTKRLSTVEAHISQVQHTLMQFMHYRLCMYLFRILQKIWELTFFPIVVIISIVNIISLLFNALWDVLLIKQETWLSNSIDIILKY